MSAPNDAPSQAAVTTPAPAPATSPAASPAAQPDEGVEVAEEQQIAVDEEEDTDDTASDMGSSLASSKTSLAESIWNFRVENGRTYHRFKDGRYLFPNDERESDRLDLQHHLFLLCLGGKLGLSPPNEETSKVKRVLDVGTGTGIWAIEFGDLHPEAEVLGMDLSPPLAQPPPNVTFEVDDIEEPWLYSRPFDYIHSRMMTSSIRNWEKFIKRSFNNLTPRGYLEIQEIEVLPESDDDTIEPDAPLLRYSTLLGEAAAVLNQPFQDIQGLVKIMRDVGFVDVYIKKFKWPSNTWPKDDHYKLLGAWSYENIISGIEAWAMAPFTRGLGWKKEEVEMFLIEVRKDLKDRSIHAYYPCYALYGKKPEEDA